MNVVQAFRRSLALLVPRDRRRLALVTAVQMATALLDLVGVLLVGVVAAAGVASATDEALPGSVSTFLDLIGVTGDRLSVVLVLALVAAAVLLLKSVVNVSLSRMSLRFLAGRQAIVASRLTLGLLSRPLLQIQQRSSQDTAYALTAGVGYAILTVVGQGLVVVVEGTLLVTLAVGLAAVDVVLTIFTIVFFLLVAMIVQLSLSKWARRQGTRTAAIEIESYQTVQEALAAYREVLVAGRRGTYAARFGDLRTQAAGVQADLQFINLLPKYVFEVALVVGGGLLAASQLMTKDATAAVATLAVFLAAGSRIVPSLLRLQGALISVQSGSAAAEPTLELAAELGQTGSSGPVAGGQPVVVPSARDLAHEGFTPSIELRGVGFTYPGSPAPVLREVQALVGPGRSLALVGPTGSGKSTLADLILGVLDPGAGSVLVGGLRPDEAVLRWPGAIAYVPQAIAIVNGSIRENVALGLRGDAIDDDLVHEALGRAHLAGFLATLPDGLETQVGESGVKLSGGQRQRLGIARALYTRPRLLVLDEATSALDAETEVRIGETLRDLEGSVTTVTIAHRLATIRHCDEILFLDHGVVEARGTFDELRDSSDRFRHHATLLGL